MMDPQEPHPMEEVNVTIKTEPEEIQIKVEPDDLAFDTTRILLESQDSKPSHDATGFTKCPKCNRVFDIKRGLKNHLVRCKGPDPNARFYYLNNCEICSASFKYPSGLEAHMNMHKGIKPYKCRVQCDTHFHNTALRIAHEKKCHGEVQICQFCNAKLSNPLMLTRHLNSQHKGAKFECNICGKIFAQNKRLAVHQRMMHSNEEPKYHCEVCGKRFREAKMLRKHRGRHDQEKPFRCEVCNAGLACSVSLKNHMRFTHGKETLPCQHCGSEFRNSSALYIHRVMVHKKARVENKTIQRLPVSDVKAKVGEADYAESLGTVDSECETSD